MNVPASQQASTGNTIVNEPTIVRMGSIPHGVTVLMQGPNPGAEAQTGQTAHPGAHPVHRGTLGSLPLRFPALHVPPQPPLRSSGAQSTGRRDPANCHATAAQHVVPEINIALDTLAPPSQSSWPVPGGFPGLYQRSQLRLAGCDRRPGYSWLHRDPSHNGYSFGGWLPDARRW